MDSYWKTAVVSVVGFLATITAITIINNPEVFSGNFCGSLGDFYSGPTAEVCISPIEYWMRAAVYWPYTVFATAFGVALGYRYQESFQE